MKYYLEQSEEVLKNLETADTGLTADVAQERLLKNGKNKLEEAKKDSLIKRFFKQMKDPMIIILLGAALISGATALYSGEEFADALVIGSTAGENNAPVLLTPSVAARKSVIDYIKGSKINKLIVIGGTARIPESVVNPLAVK